MSYIRIAGLVLGVALTGCAASEGTGNGGRDLSGGGGDDASVPDDGGVTGLDDGGVFQQPDGQTVVMDPVTCTEAAANKSYIGCDYWPTVVANAVWNIFDFAVVVSNPGTNPADITVTGPNATNQMVTVMPGALQKIYLPWVTSLKGADANNCGQSTAMTASVSQAAGAYHLVSSVPVLVYQFNALEYKGAGGPAGKDWSSCPGNTKCMGTAVGCFSFSNDASLLLPSTAMTGNYRILGEHGLDNPLLAGLPGLASYVAITATQNTTTVKVKVSSTGKILAGTGVTATNAGGTATFTMNAGDVVELVGDRYTASDLSGSQVQADKPVQVIGGIPCTTNPNTYGYSCDHIEETVMPAETLGAHYVVTTPTGPRGIPVGASIRLVGNVDGTTLQYSPSVSGAPASLNAGQVVEFMANTDFVVSGNHEFIVGIVQQSGQVVDSTTPAAMQEGDPSLSSAIAVEQYRLKYVFLAPDDYDSNYADVVAPLTAMLMLDGGPVTVTPTKVGNTSYGVFRIKLTTTNGGAHTLTSDQPAGLQVLGYGLFTSYQYPGGLDLLSIAPPPPPIQ